MTLVGKIFTVLILVMSVAFMMLAATVFATHRNWRDVVLRPASDVTAEKPLGLKLVLEELKRANDRLVEEKELASDKLAIEQASRRYALAALQTRAELAEERLTVREREYAQLQAQNGLISETLRTNQMNLEEMTKENETLRRQIVATLQARDEQFNTVVQITDKLNTLEGERQKLAERQNQLLAQISRMKNVLEKNDLTEFDPVDDRAPEVDGVVTAVGQRDLIEISIGSDDGLREGHTLEVFRDNSYLGRVMIQRTEPDRAVARILRAYRKGIIRKGDRVATKLS